ncbi:MAG: LacI family transcriptional regulator [Verrucomicrobiota bacterium]|nr:LacI family transcriptional regulator [Verrucomicrobiota bacterium]
MVRLKDIAAQAGVSVMTVSKALRDESDISATTKTRLKLLAQQMGYLPDSLAQGLRNRTTKLFGVVIPTVANPIFAQIVLAIEESARPLGYDIILAHTLNIPEREESHLRRLLSRRVDGLFISPVYRLTPSAPIYEEMKRRKIPVVILGQPAPFCSSFANVESDDAQGSYQMTKHLLELGHRRIVFFTGPTVSPAAQERLEGYRRGLREAKIELDDRLIFNAGATIEEGEKAALQMCNEMPKATAVQCAYDLVAIGAATVFLNQGLKIPQDLSMTGFGNILMSEYFRVPLTTVRQPKRRLGAAAVETMLKLQRGEHFETKRLPTELIIRSSTALPR